MKDRVIPFALGMAFGHYGLRWCIHVSYIAAVIGAFELGKYLH